MHVKLIERISSVSKIEKGEPSSKQLQTITPIITDNIILWQSFSMIFLAEWGDRSQIATIALGASYSLVGVTLGALFGHFISTLGAVELGEWIGKRIRERTVHFVAGVVFILSGLVTLGAVFIVEE